MAYPLLMLSVVFTGNGEPTLIITLENRYMPRRIRLPQPRQNPANSGGEPTETTDRETPWNPETVQRLINRAQRRGQHPAILCLGRNEAKALQTYLAVRFDDDEVSLSSLVYAELKIVQIQEDNFLDIETLESIFEGSRHAQIVQINEQLIKHKRDGHTEPTSRFRFSL
jgi:hypothetical protein